MKQSEHVLYITLIDFLLQLLFLALVLGVIYAAQQPSKNELVEVKKIEPAIKKIKELTGISDLRELTDELSRLGPLSNAVSKISQFEKIKPSIEKIGGIDAAEKLLKAEAGKKGQGMPSCLEGGAKIANFDSYSDKIVFATSLKTDFDNLLSELNISKEKISSLSLEEFRQVFAPLILRNKRNDCIYNINLIEHSFDTRPRDSFRSIFMTYTQKANDIK